MAFPFSDWFSSEKSETPAPAGFELDTPTAAPAPPPGFEADGGADDFPFARYATPDLSAFEAEPAAKAPAMPDLSGGADAEPDAPRARRTRYDGLFDEVGKEYGVDPKMLRAFAQIESSGNPRARTGSYNGMFMLSNSEFAKHGGAGNIYDPVENTKAAARKYRTESDEFAQKYGRDPSASELYLLHQQGWGGAEAHWRNPDQPAWMSMASTGEGRQKGERWARQAIWGNVPDDVKRRYGSVDNISSRQFAQLWDAKVRRFGGGDPMPGEDDPQALLDSLKPQAPAPLPEGFELDTPAPDAAVAPPPGFELDTAEAAGKGAAPATFGQSFARGVDLAQQMAYGAAEATGEATGIDSLTQFGREGRKANTAEIAASGVPRSKVADIKSWGDFTQWAKETAGEQIPLMAPSVAGGIAGGSLGAVVGGPAAPATATIGALIGAFVPSLVLGVGETQASIKDKDPNAVAPGYAFAGGSAIAALDSILPGKVGGALVRKFGAEAAEEIAKKALMKPAAGGIIKRTAKGAATGLAVEGVTEAVQEAIGEVAAAKGTDTNIDWASLKEQMIEAGAAGMLMGGAVSGIEASVNTGNSDTDDRRDDKATKDAAKAKALPGAQPGLPAPAVQQRPAPEAPVAGKDDVIVPPAPPGAEILKQNGWSDAAIADMGPEEAAEHIAEAEAQTAAGLAPDAPSAEPIKDLVAQAADLANPDNPRQAVWLPRTSVDVLRKDRKANKEVYASGVALKNFDGKGGALVVRDQAMADKAIAARDAGENMQAIIGGLTGSGSGKPIDGSTVVQQVTADGAVTRESLVTPATQAATEQAFAAPDREVRAVPLQEAIDRRDAEINTVPPATSDYSPAQGEANNRALGHMKWNGLDLSIETDKDGVRQGVSSKTGKPYTQKFTNPYGYIKGTMGADDMHVDVHVGPMAKADGGNPAGARVYVIDELDKETGEFRQHKAMVGYANEENARAAYADTEGKNADMIGAVTQMTVPEFKDWLAEGKRTDPLGEIEPVEKPGLMARAAKALGFKKSRREAWDGPQLTDEEIDIIAGDWSYIRKIDRMKSPQSLASFVIANGGLQDDAREVRHIAGAAKERPGLVNKNGLKLDDMARKAWEAGFFHEGTERPDISEFLDALQDDLHSGNVVRGVDEQMLDDEAAADEMMRTLHDEYNIDVTQFRTEDGLRKWLGQDTEAKRGAPATGADQGSDSEEAPFEAPEKVEPAKPEKGQTSLVPEATTKEKIAAASKAGEKRGGNEPMDVGMFGSAKDQTDLVDMAKQEPKEDVLPAGVTVELSSKRLKGEEARLKGGEYKAIAQREKPWSSVDGYGDTPEAAKANALAKLGPESKKKGILGTTLDALMGKKQGGAVAVDKVTGKGNEPATAPDTKAWLEQREQRLRASKAAGNKHLDDLPRAVEGMRGVEFYNAHDPKERGTVRTVANTGEVVVNWADEYSAEKNLVSEQIKDGKNLVWQSWLLPTDLKDYVVGKGEVTSPLEAIKAKLMDTGFGGIVEARKFAKESGFEGTVKEVDELIEQAAVLAARDIVAETKDAKSAYEALVALYDRQPNLGVRTSESVSKQAYSTPVPLAYIASRLAGVRTADVVFEPTAGNGALLIEAGPGNDTVYANELDEARAAALKALGFEVTTKDAASPIKLGEKADAIVANPPFGAVREDGQSKGFTVDGLQTTQIDHAISLQALAHLTPDGKAVLILGGVKADSAEELRKGYRGQAKREFFYKLYHEFNVVDHFQVRGELYQKQGAGWPVDVVVINGRRPDKAAPLARSLPAANPPTIYKSWADLAQKIEAVNADEAKPVKAGRDSGKAAATPASQPEPAPGNGDRGKPAAASGPVVLPGESGDDAGGLRVGSDRAKPANEAADRDDAGGLPASTGGERGRADKPAAASEREPGLAPAKREPQARVKNTTGQTSYAPSSSAMGLNTLVPTNMADANRAAMAKVEADHGGSIDTFVAERLGYDTDADGAFFMRKDEDGKLVKERPFAAEQMDAIAAAIDNVEKGAGFIIGDQTGIGKGRICAAMLRYAILHDMAPVLLTEKPDLYGDMYRDLRDIGMPEMLGRELNLFMTNTGETVTLDEEALEWKEASDLAKANGEKAPKRKGTFLIGGGKARQDADMSAITRWAYDPSRERPFDVILTTYDQMNTVKGGETARRDFLRSIAPKALIIMDEAHNAGGAAQTGWKSKNAPMNRADFARDLVAKAGGVVYSSATYAKRPDVMDLYARTDMGKAVDDPKKLPELIERGGVPMQQVVASMLSRSGQYMRRERSFEGIDYAVVGVPVSQESYKQFSGSVRAVFRFDLAVTKFRKDWMKDQLDGIGGVTTKDGGVGKAAAHATSFAGIMHNIVAQMLLAIKAGPTADRAIAALKDGKKPVLGLSNTMEAFISDFAEANGISVGQAIDLDFGDVLARYLSRTLRITIKLPDGTHQHKDIPPSSLPGDLRAMYDEALKNIRDGDYAGMPVSPVDWLRHRLTEAGYSVAEVTGRKGMIDYSGEVPMYVARPKKEMGPSGKRSSIAAFNRGTLDALIINRSGSTGVSMHAKSNFKDRRPRRMLLVQAEPNIDTHMQMLGRVNRTGQVVLPDYEQIAAEVPAEARPTAVLMKKMASLNANTTGARGSVFLADSVDFMNQYGDQAVYQVLHEDNDFDYKMGYPLEGPEDVDPTIDAARKATGRLVLLDPEEQTEFLNRVQQVYKAEIERLDALGENALEAKSVDLQAKTLETTVLKEKQGAGDSPFLEAAVVQKVSAKAQGRAMPPAEVAKNVGDGVGHKGVSVDDAGAAEAWTSLEAMGKEAAAERINDVKERSRPWIAREVTLVSDEKKAGVKLRHEANLARWVATATLAYPGRKVTLALPNGDMDGIVTFVGQSGKAKNPAALSTWDVVIAVPDAARQYIFPMSKLFPPGEPKSDDEKGAEIRPSRISNADLVQRFIDARKEGRETRYIVTGNILAGYDQVNGKGQIINYTTDEGETHPGVLMPREFELAKFLDARSVALTSGDAVAEFLDKVPDAKVSSTDQIIEVRRFGGNYLVEVPASRQTGGKYFTEQAVRDSMRPAEFVKSGNVMKVQLTRSPLVRLLEAMRKVGAVFETKEAQDIAQAIVGARRAALGPAFRRNAVLAALRMGKAVSLKKEADTLLDLLRSEPSILPSQVREAVIERIEPISDGLFKVIARSTDGETLDFVERLDDIKRTQGLFTVARDGSPFVVFFSFETPSSFGEGFRGVRAHEGIHALREFGFLAGKASKDATTWGALVGHAELLGIMGMTMREFGGKIRHSQAASWSDQVTIMEAYLENYKDWKPQRKREALDQEAVAHMLQLYVHGGLTDQQVAPVKAILDAILNGEIAKGRVVSDAARVLEYAMHAGAPQRSFLSGRIIPFRDRLKAAKLQRQYPFENSASPLDYMEVTRAGQVMRAPDSDLKPANVNNAIGSYEHSVERREALAERRAYPDLKVALNPLVEPEAFFDDMFHVEDGASLTEAAAFEAYNEWAEDRGVKLADRADLADFRRAIRSAGVSSGRIAGRLRFIGIRLLDAPRGLRAMTGEAADARASGTTTDGRELDAHGLYSPSLEAAKKIERKAGTVQAMKNALLKAGGKPKELEAIGFDKAFPDLNAQLTRDELVTWLRANRLVLGRVVRGGEKEEQNWDVAYTGTSYEGYSTPGGLPDTYREVVTTLPATEPRTARVTIQPYGPQSTKWEYIISGETGTFSRTFETEAEARAAADKAVRELHPDYGKPGPNTYTHSHWRGITNPLVHYRAKDFAVAADKKARVLEEVQTDWGQAARKHGFRGDDQTAAAAEAKRTRIEADAAEQKLRRAMQDMENQRIKDIHFPWTESNGSYRMHRSDLGERVIFEYRKSAHEGRFDIYQNGHYRGDSGARPIEVLKREAEAGEGRPVATDYLGMQSRDIRREMEFFANRYDPEQLDRVHELWEDFDAKDGIAMEAAAESGGNSRAVPRAPFIDDTNDWVDLAAKQFLIDSLKDPLVERIAWAPGSEQIRRYPSLSQVVGKIAIESAGQGIRNVSLYKADQYNNYIGSALLNEQGVITSGEGALAGQSGTPISDIVGHGVAKQIMSADVSRRKINFAPDDTLDIKKEGAGMRAFYGDYGKDGTFSPSIVGARLLKLLKAMDPAAKIEPTDMGYKGHNYPDGTPLVTPTTGPHFPSIAITPAIRAAVAKGLPMFGADQGTPLSRAIASMTPAQYATAKETIERAVNIIAGIAGPIQVVFQQTIETRQHQNPEKYDAIKEQFQDRVNGTSGGVYYPSIDGAALIMVATSDPSFLPSDSAAHEAWHHVVEGLASKQEVAMLRSPAEQARMRKMAAKEIGLPEDHPAMLNLDPREIEAYAFQRYRRLHEAGAGEASGLHMAIRKLFDRIIQVLRATANAWRGLGFDTAESMFDRAMAGDYAVISRQMQAAMALPDGTAETDDGVTLTTSSEPGFHGRMRAESKHGWVTASIDPDKKIVTIATSSLNPDTPIGKGHGSKLYRAIIDAALSAGYTVESSRSVSKDARRVYESLARNGYLVETINPEGMQGDKAPVYRITQSDVLHSSISRNTTVVPPVAGAPGVIGRSIRRTLTRVSSRLDPARVLLQDRALQIRRQAVERVEAETGQPVPVNLDTWVAEALYHGKVGKRADTLRHEWIEPIVEAMKLAGLDREAVDEYLYARHAEERNIKLGQLYESQRQEYDAMVARGENAAKIKLTPAMEQFIEAMTNPDVVGGSGMSANEARAVLAAARASGKQAGYDGVASLVDDMQEEARKNLLKAGLISREQFDDWQTQYAHYVPLRGFELGDAEDADGVRSGRGYDVRGKEAEAALGRRSKADSPLGYAMMQAVQAIVRAEKNRVAKTLMRAVEAYPNDTVWEVYRGEYSQRLNPATGLVERYWVRPPFARDDELFASKVGGKTTWIWIKHRGLARAMRNVGSEVLGTIVGRTLMKVTRTYAQLLTSWNPEFMFGNAFRDLETALFNLADIKDAPPGTRMKILTDAFSFKSIRGIMNALRGDGSSEYARWFEEYQNAGGQISFMGYSDIETIKADIEKSLTRGDMRTALRGAVRIVEDMNTAVENGARLSVYVALRRAGVAKDRAAFVARELTVNFNRKGELGPAINSLYIFFNASVQGTTRMVTAVARSKALRYALAAVCAAGLSIDWLNALLSGDDDDGKNAYDKLSPWIKERNLVIMIPGTKNYIMIPLAYGYNVPYVAGNQLGQVLRGKQDPLEAAASIAGSTLNMFNPLGTSPFGKDGSFWQMVSPTLMDPGVQTLENKTWYGGPIYPTKFDKRQPDSENFYPNTPWWWVETARIMNDYTGGSIGRSGLIDVSPETLEHYAEFAMGGVGKFALHAIATGQQLMSGDEWTPEKTPFLRRLYGKATSVSRRREFYEAWDKVDGAAYEVKKLQQNKEPDEARAARVRNAAELEAFPTMHSVMDQLKDMRKQRDSITSNAKMDAAEKKLRIDAIVEKENAAIIKALAKYDAVLKGKDK